MQDDHGTKVRMGIARAKARGVAWGRNGARLAEQNRAEADRFAMELRPLILEVMLSGHRRPTRLARELNRRGVTTRKGNKWYPVTAQRLVGRLQPSLGEEFAEADKVQQQEFWSKLQAGDTGAIC